MLVRLVLLILKRFTNRQVITSFFYFICNFLTFGVNNCLVSSLQNNYSQQSNNQIYKAEISICTSFTLTSVPKRSMSANMSECDTKWPVSDRWRARSGPPLRSNMAPSGWICNPAAATPSAETHHVSSVVGSQWWQKTKATADGDGASECSTDKYSKSGG